MERGESPTAPPATGARLEWADVPARVRAAVESWLASAVVEAVSQPSGFSPGAAARLRTADGRRVFAKAAGPELNARTPVLHRREAGVVAALPPEAPVARLLWSHDEGDGGWVALVFEDVEGRQPAVPWRTGELDRVLAALAALSAALTPSPLPVAALSSAAAWPVMTRGGGGRSGRTGRRSSTIGRPATSRRSPPWRPPRRPRSPAIPCCTSTCGRTTCC